MPKRTRKVTDKALKQEMHTPVKKQAKKLLSTGSDTDTESLAESGGFQVGDKVFAKVKSCPQPWPAKILQKAVIQSTPSSNIPSTPGKGKKEKAKAGGIKLLIQFYGTYDSEYVKPEQLLPYNDENSNKFGRPNPSRGATLFQVAMKEIQSRDSYPLPRTRRQSTRPARVRQSTPPPRTRSAPAERVQTPGQNPGRDDSDLIEAEITLEPESPVQPSVAVTPKAQTPVSRIRTPGLKASQTQTDPVKIQPVTPSEQQQMEKEELLQESGPEQEVDMEFTRIRKRTRSVSAAAEAEEEEPKAKKLVKPKRGKKGKKPSKGEKILQRLVN